MPVNSPKHKERLKKDNFAGIKALVMGLGLHGGGLESARYLAERGADVTVTDLRDEEALLPSVEKLKALPISSRAEIEAVISVCGIVLKAFPKYYSQLCQ